MTYEAWRISYQDSEQAARAAYRRAEELAAKLDELEQQEPVGWVFVDDPAVFAMPGTGYHAGKTPPQNAIKCEPRYARPIPAESKPQAEGGGAC